VRENAELGMQNAESGNRERMAELREERIEKEE
jgi:hypothetical protein